MATYPDLPDNRLIVGGIDLSVRYRMVLLDGYELNPPEPKTYTVDIPGGNGVIDLTEALTGDVVYNNREQKFTFVVIDVEDFEKVKTEVSNFLHGKEFDYTMTMDPGYTYHGRFSVESYSHSAYSNGILGNIVIKVSANPYKLKTSPVYKLNAYNGKLYSLESGRRPINPIIEVKTPTRVTFDGKTSTVPVGTHRLNDVLFKMGQNNIYINTKNDYTTRWGDLAENEKNAMIWDAAKAYTWDEISHLNFDKTKIPQSWNDLSPKTWADIADKRWVDLNYAPDDGDAFVSDNLYVAYLKYDWEDL